MAYKCIRRELGKMKHSLEELWSWHFSRLDSWLNQRDSGIHQSLIASHERKLSEALNRSYQEQKSVVSGTIERLDGVVNKLCKALNENPTQQLEHNSQLLAHYDDMLAVSRTMLEGKDKEIQILRKEKSAVENTLREHIEKFERHQRLVSKSDFYASGPSYKDGSPNPSLLESSVNSTVEAISTFCNNFSKYLKEFPEMELSELNDLKEEMYVTKPAHTKFVVKAFVSEVIFRGFETEGYWLKGGFSWFLDPDVLKRESFQCYNVARNTDTRTYYTTDELFHIFSNERYALIVPEWTENDDAVCNHSEWDLNHKVVAAETELHWGFLTAARRAWALQKLCLSFDSPATIFRVGHGMQCNENYMDSVVELDDDSKFVNEVGFMIYPGFRIKKSIVKSQIYLAAAIGNR